MPCFVDELWPSAGIAAVELIEAVGFEVRLVDAVCCGQPLANAGEAREAERVRAFWQKQRSLAGEAGEVVVLSASCTGHLRQTAAEAASRAGIREFCEWFLEHAPARYPRRVERSVALHSSCSAIREVRSDRAARALLDRVPGLVVHEPEHYEECCGFGGSFSAAFAELSYRMGADKVAALARADENVDTIVSADCSCLLHLRGIADPKLRFRHVAEILREAVA